MRRRGKLELELEPDPWNQLCPWGASTRYCGESCARVYPYKAAAESGQVFRSLALAHGPAGKSSGAESSSGRLPLDRGFNFGPAVGPNWVPARSRSSIASHLSCRSLDFLARFSLTEFPAHCYSFWPGLLQLRVSGASPGSSRLHAATPCLLLPIKQIPPNLGPRGSPHMPQGKFSPKFGTWDKVFGQQPYPYPRHPGGQATTRETDAGGGSPPTALAGL
ncbi:uncharacterized protein CLUP02_09198 [Colletotrichum lupini]|uniref:Uncharacterized protein n=1 Tax=Colletotrichum lupini TaxID=145971 RepID=A0A9Q8SW41_9PEZI|nr:uncharacterized protein CLUP02_09198 [Colletotrichum lupini]UQC83702.1 hypothetical protein CLUP02_09198 [Colletotrichum lupini]